MTPVNTLLSLIPIIPEDKVQQSIIDVFYTTFGYGLLSDTRFAIGIEPVKCTGSSCTSVFLPGGVQTVRLGNGSTLFDQQRFGDLTAIIVHDAPGYQLEFYPRENHTFNETTECKTYGEKIGDHEGKGIHMCIGSSEDGNKTLVGKQVDSIDSV